MFLGVTCPGRWATGSIDAAQGCFRPGKRHRGRRASALFAVPEHSAYVPTFNVVRMYV
jgi:hypothetical protein